MPINIYKPIGITPLELIKIYKKLNNIKDKMSFAGRLDPMAHGEMILLRGEECKLQDSYCGKDKIYEFEVLYGIKTDSLDILGIPNFRVEDTIKYNPKDFIGPYEQEYPHYSSIHVKRKPLWLWAKEGRIGEIKIPKKKITIYSLDSVGSIELDNKNLIKTILKKLENLSIENRGKFRYDEIREQWLKLLIEERKFKIGKYRVKVSSGTYVRTLCDRMGGIAYDINRTNIIF